jgi:NAD+ synthetase
VRIALAQLDPTVGDVEGNARLVEDAIADARRERADLLVTPELVLIGYPPRDLLHRKGVVEACERAVERIAAAAGEMIVVVGHPHRAEAGLRGLRNRASICRGGNVVATHDKQLLPGYDVFDEDRYFDPGRPSRPIDVAGRRVGVLICEDLWRADDVTASARYASDPVADAAARGCDVLVSLNASPFVVGKYARHRARARALAGAHRAAVVMVNQVGANDDLVFDGRSFAVGPDGRTLAALRGWAPDLRVVDLDAASPGAEPAAPAAEEEVFHALVLGVRDYCRKTGQRRALVGISGGIDSAVTAAIGAAALGAENVCGLVMPGRYSSPGSRDDARALAAALKLGRVEEISIEALHESIRNALALVLGDVTGVTDENLQARARGVVLMACANAWGGIVLATSNKSELATGYCTLYGDMCGAIAVLGDVLKTRVYALARWINAHPEAGGFAQPPIPEASLTKPPSAELRPNQTDQDTLPPYDVLDAIVARVVEREQSADAIVAATGFDAALVTEVMSTIDRNEHKRNQAALVLKVTPRAFGRGRSMPIVARVQSAAPCPSDRCLPSS